MLVKVGILTPIRVARLKSLLNQLGMSDCYCENIDDLKKHLDYTYNTIFDYSQIDCRIDKLRNSSFNFLISYCHK